MASFFDGRVIAPGDPEYDQAYTVFCGGIDRKPAAIILQIDPEGRTAWVETGLTTE